jgi:hypothetical protein
MEYGQLEALAHQFFKCDVDDIGGFILDACCFTHGIEHGFSGGLAKRSDLALRPNDRRWRVRVPDWSYNFKDCGAMERPVVRAMYSTIAEGTSASE